MNSNLAVLSKINEDRNETNIKDTKLRKKLDLLMNNVCIQKLEENKYTFFKYFASKQKGILYCLLLTGDELDGIYEFKVFGHDLKFETAIMDHGVVTKVCSVSNYNLAEFDMKDVVTEIKKENDITFRKEIKKFLPKIIDFDVVTIKFKNEIMEITQKNYDEISFKKEIRSILKNRYEDIESIEGLEKKKKLYISALDLGVKEFKKSIIDLNLVTEEEYSLYTKFDNELFEEYKKKFKLIEIVI